KSLSQPDSLPTGCQWLDNEAHGYGDNHDWQMEYDTAMKFVDQCATSTSPRAEAGFIYITQATDELGNGGSLRSNTYAWLKSVLYLNTTDPEYFCQCVYAMSGEIPVPNHISPDTGYDWGLALIRWMMQNTNCDSSELYNLFKETRNVQIHTWLNDTTQYRLDTTIPPLSVVDPGLDTLLARHFFYATVGTPQGILSNASAYPNPTGTGTVISFGIAKEAYVKIELYDVLGHAAGSNGFESLFEPGNKAVPISLAGLPSGTYFARIQTAYGEVESVKIVKQ
ncbi:MAG TPA: T9SS type A sorting domain-containing protein, partial [Candidatus Kapabacteria bacterium]